MTNEIMTFGEVKQAAVEYVMNRANRNPNLIVPGPLERNIAEEAIEAFVRINSMNRVVDHD